MEVHSRGKHDDVHSDDGHSFFDLQVRRKKLARRKGVVGHVKYPYDVLERAVQQRCRE